MQDLVNQVNQNLKAENIQLRMVLPKGRNKIYVRGNFPPKPGSNKIQWRRQTVSLGDATLNGIGRGEQKIKQMALQLKLNEFSWEESPIKPQGTISSWIKKYERYLKHHVLSGSSKLKEEKWYGKYLYGGLTWLPQHKPLSQEAIIEGINHYPPGTPGRENAIRTYKKFCQFCNLQLDFSPYRGRVKPVKRDLSMVLGDDEIFRHYRNFNGCWRWQPIFGLMATYGLRNHEIFFCTLEVDKGDVVAIIEERKPDIEGKPKTGYRVVLPLYNEWAEQWNLLENFKRPKVEEGSTVRELGHRVCKAFQTRNFAYPYRCRISYAIRGTCREKIPIPVMARLMGHSPDTHLRKYQKYFPGNEALDIARDILKDRAKNDHEFEEF